MAGKISKYVIITPAKNEEQNIEYTINSVCDQTLKPKEWIIVDDGSTDNTSAVVEKYIKLHNWIKLIKRKNHSKKTLTGSKTIRAFQTGFNELVLKDYGFIVKLDADLSLPNYYFETIVYEFQKNKKIGICGGICVIEKNGKLYEEKAAEYHIRGAIKAYRKECFQEIGGLMPVLGWDGIDQFLAMYHGWELRRLNELKVIHHRKTGEDAGQYLRSLRAGIYCCIIGYDPLLTLLHSLKRTFNKKLNLIHIIVVIIGYLSKLFSEKLLKKEQRKFIRKFQYKRIKMKLLNETLKFVKK